MPGQSLQNWPQWKIWTPGRFAGSSTESNLEPPGLNGWAVSIMLNCSERKAQYIEYDWTKNVIKSQDIVILRAGNGKIEIAIMGASVIDVSNF